MKQFCDDIIAYLTENLNNDSDYKKTVRVDYANKQSLKMAPPHVFVQLMKNTDAEEYDTFGEGEIISYCPFQISVYCQQMEIDGSRVSAQEAAMVFYEKISTLFDKNTLLAWNNNILKVRRIGDSFALPVGDGVTTYCSVLRYEFYIHKNYKKIN